jgi:hypothetical protein
MFDQTETACVLAGIAAVGAIFVVQSQNRSFSKYSTPPSECSARVGSLESSGISARAASVEEVSDSTLFSDNNMWNNMSEEGEDSMSKNASRFPGGGRNTEATKKNMEMVKPVLSLETTGAKTVGTRPLIAGRCGQETTEAKMPEVTGECMFFMSDAYADRLMSTQQQN